jgi:hypothetical protein
MSNATLKNPLRGKILTVIVVALIAIAAFSYYEKVSNPIHQAQSYPIDLTSVYYYWFGSNVTGHGAVTTVQIDTIFPHGTGIQPQVVAGKTFAISESYGLTDTTYVIGQYLHLIRTYQDSFAEKCDLNVTQAMIAPNHIPTGSLMAQRLSIQIPSNIWS